MAWNPLDLLDYFFDAIELFTSGSRAASDKKILNSDGKPQQMSKESESAGKIDGGARESHKTEINKSSTVLK
ncbi:hypothetical protein ACVVIH_23830 [Chryseobacterium arthrosphaerae]|uniref:hypothetical protein n=1 Tax=Chryseobacterium arthrosphaerae TaxID=651561 RepID=UPI001BAEB12D|nr:hypothetical protein [Chryseobacterium arthrosphaerae]QUY56683.1 hypothetical protein I2F65_04920 [Chryseobacterium arthrosphaerae]